MGLRDVVNRRKTERERPKTLAELRAAKKDDKPKTLAELRASKKSPPADERKNGLAALRASKGRAKKSKQDFQISGMRFHNARAFNGYWMIDVSNGDKTYTLHNKHGAWFHSVEGREGWLVEPVRVARALGTSMGQLDMSMALSTRLERELRARGLPTREQRQRQQEEAEREARRKAKKHVDGDQD